MRAKKISSSIGIASSFVFLALALVRFPTFPVSHSHDSGSQAAIEYWVREGIRFGAEINQNVGPFGFISFPTLFTGILDSQKMFIEIFLVSSLAVLVVSELRKRGRKLAGAALFVFGLSTAQAQDSLLYLLAALSVVAILEGPSLVLASLGLITLSILACGKGAFAFVWLAALGALVLIAVAKRDGRRGGLALGLIMVLSFIWTAIGQRIADLPAYFHGMVWFVRGYNEAMIAIEPLAIGLAGVGAVTLLTCGIMMSVVVEIRRSKRIDLPLAIGLLQLFIGFAAWKHGFVRADLHVRVFFGYVVLFVLFGSSFLRSAFADRSRIVVASIAGALALAFVGNRLAEHHFANPQPLNFLRAARNASILMELNPRLEALRSVSEEVVSRLRDPALESLVGRAPVAYFGARPAPSLFMDLDLRISPSTISFAAWNERIARRDRDFFRSADLKYVIFAPETIDGRFLPADSSLAQLELLENFELVGEKDERLYLRRKSNREIEFSSVSVRDIELFDTLELPPPGASERQWLTIETEHDHWESAVGVLYKPNLYFIEVAFPDGSRGEYRIVREMARLGFLTAPVLLNAPDWITALKGAPTRSIRSLRMICRGRVSPCSTRFRVEVSSVRAKSW